MIFKEYKVPASHNNYLQSIYYFECKHPDKNKFFVPDGNLELMLSNRPLSVLVGGNLIIKEEKNLFWGQIRFTGTIESVGNYEAFGIKFQPWMLPLFKDPKARGLVDNVLTLNDVISKNFVNRLEQFFTSWRFEEPNIHFIENLTIAMENELLSKIVIKPDLKNLVISLKNKDGVCSISDLHKIYKQSPRTLEYDFQKYLGIKAKEFQNIIRFRKSCVNILESRNIVSTALDYGYYDQAHFTNCFKKICSKTPSIFLNEGNLILSSL